jgi:ABC-type protease/lipase transport system fused ATPase/permease subunit
MQHASQLDLAAFEDPVFYDKLSGPAARPPDESRWFPASSASARDLVTLASLSGALILFSLRPDSVDLREYSGEDLHQKISGIFQDYMRYELSVKENIGFGKFEHLDREASIEAAARKSLAAAVIAKLPNRFDQMIGRRFDGGVDLST